MAKSKKKKLSYISVPSQIITSLSSSSLQSLLLSPKKSSQTAVRFLSTFKNPRLCFLLLLIIFSVLGMARIGLKLDHLFPFSNPTPCSDRGQNRHSIPVVDSALPISTVDSDSETTDGEDDDGEAEFWKQPDGLGYRPCLVFSREYRRWSGTVSKERRKYLMVVVSGGLNQQRNQIVDAVVIARILGAALVVPILQVNVIWGDESEFSDIFDLEHFKKTLENDVRIVSSLPSTHLMSRPVEEKQTPLHVSPKWIRSRYLRRLNKEGVLLLRGLDSRLSEDLPSDLQKLRCKVIEEPTINYPVQEPPTINYPVLELKGVGMMAKNLFEEAGVLSLVLTLPQMATLHRIIQCGVERVAMLQGLVGCFKRPRHPILKRNCLR